jgi:two-component system, OmpR family, response regulator ChvI
MTEQAAIVAVVDDDRNVLESFEDLLKSAGYGVRLFPSASALLATDALQSVDCLITDISLPGMSGLELERHARRERPELPVILITAQDNAWKEAQPVASSVPGRFLFPKPLEADLLIATIAKAIREPPSGKPPP